MKLRSLGFALLCGASTAAFADAEHDRIASERAAANAKFAQQKRECETRFVVAPCLEDARNENREVLAQLRQRELKLDEGQRKAAAEARRKAIAEKTEAQQARASDAAQDAPRVRVRREPPAPAASAARAGEMLEPRTPATAADRAVLEQRSRAGFEARAREAQAHRDAVARRNAQRAAQGKVAAPLPVPAGASAPR